MLKVDVYVKIVLTAIAISLMVIAFRPGLSTPAEAGERRGHFPSIAISEGRDRDHLMLWLAGDEGIELVEFSDVGRVDETYFIPYDRLWEGNWIYRVVFQEGVISQRRVRGRRVLFRPSGHTKEVIIKEVIAE